MNEEDNESFSYIPFQLYNIPKTKEEHRNLKPIFSENYLNTDISLIGNVDDINHKKYRKKNQQKLNQRADNVRNCFIVTLIRKSNIFNLKLFKVY